MSKANKTELALEPASEARVATFIRKIYSILEEQLFPEIVDWNSEGTAVVIKKPTEFGQKVLPKYFKHNHISSFIRQLNMYSFQKKRSRHAGHIYCHELFQRGQKQLLPQIKRKVKDNFSVNSQTPSQDNSSQQQVDFAALADENKMLKELQKQVFSKVQGLEQKLKELVMQNQALQNQLHQQKQKEHAMALNFQKVKQDSMNQLPFVAHERPMPQQVFNAHNNRPQIPHNTYPHQFSHPHPFCPNGIFSKAEGQEMVFGDNNNNNMVKQPRYDMGVAAQGGYYMSAAQNSFPYNGFSNHVVNHNNKLEAVSPSTKPSPKSTKDTCPSPDLRAPALSFIDYNPAETSLLKKRELDLSYDKKAVDDCGVEEIKKFVKTSTPFEGASLNVGDIKKYQSNFFSSWGEKDYCEPRCDGDLDLLCFE